MSCVGLCIYSHVNVVPVFDCIYFVVTHML